ncbi:MAG: ATP-binding cassette domain-containing protein [Bacilli bacterium]|nr:ATP-binding cassette domain-containing protein [Bacilli bacterium]
MIKLDNVSFSFSASEEILDDVSFEMKDGEFVGILGPNGGGKSTFLRVVLGLLKPQKGSIEINERKIAYVSQTTSLNDSSFPATVKEIVGLGLVGNKPTFMVSRKNKEKIDIILKEFGLFDIRNKLISELSGGQLQKVKIAKALISNPSLVVLDEPDAGIDESGHEMLVDTINDLHEKGVSILFVSHHKDDLENADHIYFIEDGKILPLEEELNRGHHHVNL